VLWPDPGDLGHRISAFAVEFGLVGKKVGRTNATMHANPMAGDFAIFDQLDQVRA
jgi:hypothetical protein